MLIHVLKIMKPTKNNASAIIHIIQCLALMLAFNTAIAQQFKIHRVEEGESIESIAKRYAVTPAEIYALNPEAERTLVPQTILLIPALKATPQKELQGFKTHRVKRRETLYRLAKHYCITESEIKAHNPFLYAHTLRRGDTLKIPIFKVVETPAKIAIKRYTVRPKEGKWRIAQRFKISVKALEALNPNMEEPLREGQQLWVPNSEDNNDGQADVGYSYYTVLPKEGFYRLKLKLGLEQDEIEALNPGLKATGLKQGMLLKVPSSHWQRNTRKATRIDLTRKISDFSTKHIAVMLPFRLDRIDFDSIPNTKTSIKTDPYLNASLDFYSGVLLALDSLKTLGVSVNVDVYDTKRDVDTVLEITDNHHFEHLDAVIGPLTSEPFDAVAAKLYEAHIPVVSPIGTHLKSYSNVFQSRPPDRLLRSKIIDYVKNDTLASNIIIVSDIKNLPTARTIKQNFDNAQLVCSRKDRQTEEDDYYVSIADIEQVLKPGRNVVFLETENEGFVSNVTSVMASLIHGDDPESGELAVEIVLTTTHYNAAFQGDQVSNDQLSKLQFHFASPSKSYYEDPNNTFVKAYAGRYGITPSKPAIRGFDLTMDVILRLVTSQNLYDSVYETPLTEYVENEFLYQENPLGGYCNSAFYFVKYSGLDVVEIP